MKDRLFEIWLSLRMGVANPAFIPLLAQYTPYDLFSMDTEAIAELSCDDKIKRALADKNLEESHRIQRYCRTNGTAATAREESARAFPHSRRGLPPLGRLQKSPKIHVGTGEESSGSGTDSTQGLAPASTGEESREAHEQLA